MRSSRWDRGIPTWALSTLLLATTSIGEAQSPATSFASRESRSVATRQERKEARKDLAAGLQLAKVHRCEEAVPKLDAAYAIDPKAATLKTLANCQRTLRRLPAAYATYRAVLDLHGSALSRRERAEVETSIAELDQLTGTLKITLSHADTVLQLDQRTVSSREASQPIRVDVGKHSLEVRREGFEPFAVEIAIEGGKQAAVEVLLRPEVKTGHLKVVEATGAEVHVIVDGKDVGSAPWEGDLEPGAHAITLEGERLKAPTQTVDLEVKTSTEITLTAMPLAPPPPRRGKYAMVVGTPGAQLAINGQPVPEPSGELDVGMYEFVISAPGFQPATRRVLLTEGEPYTESIELLPIPPEARALRMGVLVGFGLPRPFSAEVDVKLWETLGVGVQYSALPKLTLAGGDDEVRISAIQGILRWFPWKGSFFLGTGLGSQTLRVVNRSASSSGGQTGTLETTADGSTLFLSPQLGWLETFDSGFTLGLSLGVQIPISSPPGVSSTFAGQPLPSTCPAAAASTSYCDLINKANQHQSDLDDAVKVIARTPLPNIDLLKLGLFF